MTTVRNILLLLFICMAATAMAQHIEQKIDEIVVTGVAGTTTMNKTAAPISVVQQSELNQTAYTNIIDALAHQPGIAQVTTGNGISKPVIRGLGYNRIVVINDGIKQEGQQWGDEHGIEIDAQTVQWVEILKGPASLMYGSDAMAGVLIFHGNHMPNYGKVNANIATEYQSNNGLFNYSVDVAGRQNRAVFDLRLSEKWAHAYKNRYDGYVPNSGFSEQAAAGMVGVNGNNGYAHLKLGYFQTCLGMVEGERDECTGLLEPADGATKSYGIAAPMQRVYHYKAVSDNALDIANGTLKLLVGYQQNVRKEFEEDKAECGLHLQLHTLNYDVHWLSREGRWGKFSMGVNGMYQTSLNRGDEFLIPNYDMVDGGVFLTATKSLRHLSLSGGVRYDLRYLSSHNLVDDDALRFAAFSRHFGSLTGSAGVAYQSNQHITLRCNLSRGYRAPNISELASNGVHEGTLRYEVGNSQLHPEESWQLDAGVDYVQHRFTAQLSLFVNDIHHYIYSERMTDANGAQVVMDEHDAYRYVQGNARLWGGEAVVDVHLTKALHWQSSLAYVNATQRNQPAEGKYLPLTPAPRLRTALHCTLPAHSYVTVGATYTLRQNHFYALYGTETATPSYTLLDVAVGGEVKFGGHCCVHVALTAQNLLDKCYQSHLSRLKYTDENPITGRMGVYNMGRNIALKLRIPFTL